MLYNFLHPNISVTSICYKFIIMTHPLCGYLFILKFGDIIIHPELLDHVSYMYKFHLVDINYSKTEQH